MSRRTAVRSALATVAALVLTACGSGAGDTPSSVPSSYGEASVSRSAATGTEGDTLAFPTEYELPTLTVPAGADVFDYQIETDLNNEVSGIDVDAFLDSVQGELEAAGFLVVRPEPDPDLPTPTLTASREGAGRLLAIGSGDDSVTVIGYPPA